MVCKLPLHLVIVAPGPLVLLTVRKDQHWTAWEPCGGIQQKSSRIERDRNVPLACLQVLFAHILPAHFLRVCILYRCPPVSEQFWISSPFYSDPDLPSPVVHMTGWRKSRSPESSSTSTRTYVTSGVLLSRPSSYVALLPVTVLATPAPVMNLILAVELVLTEIEESVTVKSLIVSPLSFKHP